MRVYGKEYRNVIYKKQEIDTMNSPYEIRSGWAQMDVSAIHRYLSEESYWAKGIPYDIVAQSLQHSFCVGTFCGTEQVGFARLITDYSTFAYLADVYILEEYRGQGLSKKMMQYLMDLDWLQGLRRLMLATMDAHGLYRQFGFNTSAFPERIMERKKENPYQPQT